MLRISVSAALCILICASLLSSCVRFECSDSDPACNDLTAALQAWWLASEGRLVAALGKAGTPNAGELWLKEPGGNWELVQSAPQLFRDVAYLNGQYLAVTQQNIYRSLDARNWQILSPLDEFRGLAFGNGVFLATSTAGPCPYYSSDGINWTLSVCGLSDKYVAAFDGAKLMAMGWLDPIYSADGINWNTSSGACNADQTESMAAAAGRFVGVGSTGTVCYSSDGGANATGYTHALLLNDIAYHPLTARFYASALAGANGGIRSSPDGTAGSWSGDLSGGSADFYSIRAVRGALYAGGPDGTIFVSIDGAHWNGYPGPTRPGFVTYAVIGPP
ncbi:MAG: hypothetical protein K1X75_13870 [Leptospirales bacterium]|nr:hypothetical protein [Leptospirales bacterium]